MKFRNLAAAAAALALTSTPVLAQSSDADLSRASAPVTEQSEMGGGSSFLLILALIVFGAGIFFLVDNEDDTPGSP